MKLFRKGKGFWIFGDDEEFISVDEEGFPFYYYKNYQGYRFGLDGSILLREEGVRLRLFHGDAQKIYDKVLAFLQTFKIKDPDAQAILRKVRAKVSQGAKAQFQAFQKVYGSISILPPDAYLSTIIQVTKGCSYNRCRFCSLYHGIPFSIRSKEELAHHVLQVKKFLGQRAILHHKIFLADANALIAPTAILLEALKLKEQHFGKKMTATFADLLHTLRKDKDDLVKLYRMGLQEVAIGMESGSPELLALLNKPWDFSASIAFIQRLKEVGMKLRLIFLLGVGGKEKEEGHLKKSKALIEQLPLKKEDILYFSPYIPPPESRIPSLPRQEAYRQHTWFKEHLKTPARISRYLLENFIY